MDYSSIEDLPNSENLQDMTSSELGALAKLWEEKKGNLVDSGEYQEFIKKMQREWAIETGIIERLYTWDQGVTETLIEQGIDSSHINHGSGINRDEAENIAALIRDQRTIVEGLFAFVKGDEKLSEHYIRSMHEQFTSHQDFTEALTPQGQLVKIPLLKGQYKQQPNNPKREDGRVHEYCPAELVTDEMERLLTLYHRYENNTPPEILSAWLHHRFTQIHPFQDGNGRIARAMASLVFLKARLFPLVIREADRKGYIRALEKADSGDISDLVKLFATRQRNSILAALGIQQQVAQSKHSQQIISNALQLLKNKSTVHKEMLHEVVNVAKKLHSGIREKLSELKEQLDPELRNIETHDSDTYNASLKNAEDGDTESYYFRRQIVEIAKENGYYADVDRYRAWVRLVIYTEKVFEFVFSIHGHGHGDNGVMVVSGFTFERIQSEELPGGTTSTNIKPCNQDIFQFNYLESEENTVNRFREWLDDSVTIALAEWQNTI